MSSPQCCVGRRRVLKIIFIVRAAFFGLLLPLHHIVDQVLVHHTPGHGYVGVKLLFSNFRQLTLSNFYLNIIIKFCYSFLCSSTWPVLQIPILYLVIASLVLTFPLPNLC